MLECVQRLVPIEIIVTIPDELAVQAEARGVSVQAFVQSLVDEAHRRSVSPEHRRSPEQIEAFFEAMAEGSEKLPAVPTASFSRASFLSGSDLSAGLPGRYERDSPVRQAG